MRGDTGSLGLTRAKVSKYRNKKVVTPHGKFDSQGEADRYAKLSMLQAAGEIHTLKRQVKFVLIDPFEYNGVKYKGTTYIADFTYWRDHQLVVEDFKGFQTPVYKLKKKLLLSTFHTIKFLESDPWT